MGYGITVIEVTVDYETVRLGRTVTELYLSYNWSGLSDIWSVHEHLHGKLGSQVITSLEQAIAKLETEGIKCGVPDRKNPNWGYGLSPKADDDPIEPLGKQPKRMPDPEHKTVFRYHLESFRDELKKYTNEMKETILFSDHADRPGVAMINEEEYTITKKAERKEKDSDDEGEDSQPSGPVTYFRDSIKGNMRIDNFEKAMYVHGVMRAKNDARAEAWYELALQMPDAP